MISNEDIIRMQLVNGLGRKTIGKILEYIEVKKITISNFSEVVYMIKELGLKKFKIDLDKIEFEASNIFESCYKSNISYIGVYDNRYPNKLLEISDKPLILYIDGNEDLLNQYNNMGIIGSRRPSQKGYEISSILAEKLSEEGCCIVSGFASGCDEAAHNGCLSVKGKTVAVIPSGHQGLPKGSKLLYNRILLNNGAVISELPPKAKAEKHTFIDRNRIIAAVSEGIIVIEGGKKGGTSHSVKFANAYNKPVAYTIEASADCIQGNIYDNNIFIIDNFEKLENFKNKSFQNILDKAYCQ